MKKFDFILTVFVLLSFPGKAQFQNDTSLYLLFTDNNETHKVDLTDTVEFPLPDSLEYKREHFEFFYYFNYYLYDGYPLQFRSVNRKDAEQLSLRQLKQYSVVTPEKLKEFIAKHYDSRGVDAGYYGRSYFDSLKYIYIVERDKEQGIATITEVELDIDIE